MKFKFGQILIIFFFICGCTSERPQKSNIIVKKWVQPDYVNCKVQFADVPSDLKNSLSITVFKTRLGSRYDDYASMRPYLLEPASRSIRPLGDALPSKPYQTRMQFSSWSNDGEEAYIMHLWESPENGMWEEAYRELRFDEGLLLADLYSIHIQSGKFKNLTSTERVSNYNPNIIPMPLPSNQLFLTTMIDGILRPYVMDHDGKNKRPLLKRPGFSYGTAISPDGTRYALHVDYQIVIGDFTTGKEWKVETGNPFNFVPNWSPDSNWILFFSGQDNYKNDIFIADRDGNNVRKIAPRNGWNGVIIFTDDGAFHTQGSEYLTWNPDSTSFVYSAQSFETSSIELYKVNISDGSRHQLTYSLKSKTFNVYPEYAKDGRWLTFVSNRTGSRQVFVMDTLDSALSQSQIAEVDSDCAAIWPRWRPDTTLKINSPGR